MRASHFISQGGFGAAADSRKAEKSGVEAEGCMSTQSERRHKEGEE